MTDIDREYFYQALGLLRRGLISNDEFFSLKEAPDNYKSHSNDPKPLVFGPHLPEIKRPKVVKIQRLTNPHLFRYDPIVYSTLGIAFFDYETQHVELCQTKSQPLPNYVKKVMGLILCNLVGRRRYWKYRSDFPRFYPKYFTGKKAGDLSSLRMFLYQNGVLKDRNLMSWVNILTGQKFRQKDPDPIGVNECIRFGEKRKGKDFARLSRIYDSYSALQILQGMGLFKVDKSKFWGAMSIDHDQSNLKLAEFADYCRAKLFGIHLKQVRIPYLSFQGKLNKEDLARLSFLKRALPPPSLLDPFFEEHYKKQQRRKLYVPLDDFKTWAKAWAKSLYKEKPYNTYNIAPSTSACIERTRKKGGCLAMFHPIMQYQVSRLFLKEQSKFDTHLLMELHNLLEFWIPTGEGHKSHLSMFGNNRMDIKKKGDPLDKSLILDRLGEILSRSETDTYAAFYSPILYHGCLNLLKLLEHQGIYLVPILLPEKGMKTRIPTKSVSFVVILAQILRSTVTWLLEADPRIRTGISDDPYERPLEMRVAPGEGIRSQDLKSASDNHSFGLTKAFYKSVWKGSKQPLPYKAKWILKILSSKQKVLYQEYTAYISEIKSYSPINDFYKMKIEKPNLYRHIHYDASPREGTHTLDQLLTSKYITSQSAKVAVKAFEKHYTKLQGFSEGKYFPMPPKCAYTTRRGQPMGLSIAWPVLPAVSLYCFERALIQGFVPDGRPFVPKGADKISTLGDDAAMPIKEETSLKYTRLLEMMGGVISKNKDYFHKNIGLFAEMIFRPLNPFNAGSISNMTGVRGGARCSNWASAYDSVTQTQKLRRYNYEEYWKYSPFFYEWEYARQFLPVASPISFGSLGLPFEETEHDDYLKKVISSQTPEKYNFNSQFSILSEPDLTIKMKGFNLESYLRDCGAVPYPPPEGDASLDEVRQFMQTSHNIVELFETPLLWEEVKRPNIIRTIHRYNKIEGRGIPEEISWNDLKDRMSLFYRSKDVFRKYSFSLGTALQPREWLRTEKMLPLRTLLSGNTLGYTFHEKGIVSKGPQRNPAIPATKGKYLMD